jgi:hypothetical protein
VKSTWHGLPGKAHWYCEVIFAIEGGDTDYNYGYSESVERPDSDTVFDLVPDGYTLIEYKVHMTPRSEGAPV